jgi:hypothetical protein
MTNASYSYRASPELLRGSPHANAVAAGQTSIAQASARNNPPSSGGRKYNRHRISKRHRKFKRYQNSKKYKYIGGNGVIQVAPVPATTPSYPTTTPASLTQQNLVTTQVANNVNGQGDNLHGGFKKNKSFKKTNKYFKKNKSFKKTNILKILFSKIKLFKI